MIFAASKTPIFQMELFRSIMSKRYCAQYQTSWNRFVHSKLWYSGQKSNFEKKIAILFNFFWHFREWFLFWDIGPAELKTGYQFITLRTNTNIYGDKKDFPSYRFRISKSNSALSKLLAIKMYRYALSANRNNKYT